MATRVRVKARLNSTAVRYLAVQTAAKYGRKSAEAIQGRAKRFAPVRTGELRESIIVVPVVIGERTRFRVKATAKHASYQEYGTGPIFARPGGVLAFKVGGRQVFVTRTSGVPATHFMRRAAQMSSEADLL